MNSELFKKIISYLEIIGGVTGLGLIIYTLVNAGQINGPLLLIFLTGIGLFLFSIISGKKLLLSTNKNGIVYSLINQLLQVFQWKLLGIGLSYSSGIELLIGIKNFSVHFGGKILISTFSMSIFSGDEFYFNVNVIPIIVIILLLKIIKKPVSS